MKITTLPVQQATAKSGPGPVRYPINATLLMRPIQSFHPMYPEAD
jgi:hypothetical protein